MKTLKKFIQLIVPLLVIFTAVESSARELPSAYLLNDESYVDDIPFDTRSVALRAGIYPFNLPEEKYVNDIPFDTRKIAGQAIFDSLYHMNEESYIDDIPFNTEKIYQNYLLADMTREYRDEPEAVDGVTFDFNKMASFRVREINTVEQPVHTSRMFRISEKHNYLMITYPETDKDKVIWIQSINTF